MPISAETPPELGGLRAPLVSLVRATLALEGRRPGELGIVLTSDAAVRSLNRRWRRIDRATDVLSFSYDDAPGRRVNGDLVVSLHRAAEQARRYRVSLGRELARLVIHGALHLTGLDHRTRPQRVRMRALEARALRAGAAQVEALERVLTGSLARAGNAVAGRRRPRASRAAARRITARRARAVAARRG